MRVCRLREGVMMSANCKATSSDYSLLVSEDPKGDAPVLTKSCDPPCSISVMRKRASANFINVFSNAFS